MKLLINSNFKAMYQGEFVSNHCKEARGEFVLDTSDVNQFDFSTLQEIAKANGFKLKKEKKENVLQNLEAEIIKLNLKEMNQMSDTEKVTQIIREGFEAKKTEDEIIVAIVTSGVPFKRAYRLYKEISEEEGFKVSPKKRAEEVTKFLHEAKFEPKEFSDVEETVKEICEKVSDTNEVQAMKLVRAFCKENEIAIPKKAKAPTGGLLVRFQKWTIENPTCSDDEAANWIRENASKPEKAEGYVKRFLTYLTYARQFAEARASKD